MPTGGSFHTKFWKARANIPPPPGTATGWMYPGVQSVVTMHMALWGPPLDVLSAIWARLLWWLRLGRRLWALSPLQRDGLLAALERLEAGRPVAVKAPVARDVVPEWGRRLEQLTADQRAQVEFSDAIEELFADHANLTFSQAVNGMLTVMIGLDLKIRRAGERSLIPAALRTCADDMDSGKTDVIESVEGSA